MKHKLIFNLCTLGLCTLFFTGCTQKQSRLEYIGAETAKQQALVCAGFSAGDVDQITADLSTRNGSDYYEISFTAGNEEYRYDIDALTGVVIDSQTPNSASQTPAPADSGAQADVQNTGTGEQNTLTDTQNSLSSQADAQGTAGNTQDSTDNTQSAPLQASAASETNRQSGNSNTGAFGADAITADQAKESALKHAGLTGDQVTFVKSGTDYEDGRYVYDIEFYTGDYKEYDYEIDAYTGEVVSYDYDAENYLPPASAGSSTLTADEAKALVLEQVPGSSLNDIWEFESDYEDGRMEYEGKLIYDNTEYEFEIDAHSGAFRSWEAEPLRR